MAGVGATYRIDEPVAGEMNHPALGVITFSFGPGTVEARSEQDELALAHLAANGIAGTVLLEPAEPAPPEWAAPAAIPAESPSLPEA